MSKSLNKSASSPNDQIEMLEKEICMMERELKEAETKVNIFEANIRAALHVQILRIRELTEIYKNLKQAKKAKRLEQKKRGKNYKEPQGIKKINSENSINTSVSGEDRQELKRLYKEAIVHVHPDKYVQDESGKQERATEITRQLITIYKSGNLEKLIDFHEHILSGNAMSHLSYQSHTISDPKALLAFLKKKKEELQLSMEEIKQSYTYTAFSSKEDPMIFIEELRQQFNQRISQLEKRTKRAKNKK